MARGSGSFVPQVRNLLSKVGDKPFAIALQQVSSHYVSCFDRAYSERLVEFIENVVVPAKPLHEIPLNQ
jgi:hypothetical protein